MPDTNDPEAAALAALGPESAEGDATEQTAAEGVADQGEGTEPEAGGGEAGASGTEADAEAAAEQARLEEIGRQLEEAIEVAESGALDKHFLTRITPEGLVIEIIDADDQPLFASASAEPAPILLLLADILVPVLGATTNDI
ncbi:MAG: hypothetical protein GTN90_15225, partial [Xanthomonadales bacterium]|nr:hypothetical protein [Xanthomonadales bacterium]